MADEPDDDQTERKSSRGGKKRFQERDEPDDDDDDRPRKKRRGDDHDDNDRPKKKRRVDDGPRVKTTDNMPIVMLLAFISSAVALLVICAGCGVWSFDWLVGGGPAGGGGGGGVVGGREFEVVSANRTPGFGALSAPNISYVLKQNKELSGSGVYVVVMRCGGVTTSEPFPPPGKGGSYSSTRPQMSLRSTSGKLEVWVERRQNPVASGGTVVSNTYVVP